MKKYLLTAVIILFTSFYANVQSQMQLNPQEISNMRKLQMAYSAISNLYVDDTDNKKLVEDAIIGMLEKLDPHSSYTNAEETRKMNEPLEAQFDGIGIEFNMFEDTLLIVHVINGGPSEKVGLLAGDRIVQVDSTIVAGVKMINNDIVKLIRGKKGTEVGIKVKRESVNELLDFRIIRDKIPVTSIDATYMADKQTGYIRLSRFAATSNEEFEASFNKLKKEGMKNLILDLQGNGGGFLHIACMLADQFLNKDKIIVYTQGDKAKRVDAFATDKGFFETGKLVVLVDEASASASEIVSGAIQDWDRGVIIGRRTFGKGLVQRPVELPDSSMIRLTVARYYTPSGRNIQKHYEKGNKENYYRDFEERYNNGEMMSADSIRFPDSLKYRTLVSGRTVYGGGGIMPDIFIPVDSTRNTDYHRKLIRNGVLNKFAINYIDKNRKQLNTEYPNVESFKKKFSVTDEIFKELFLWAEKDNIEYNDEQFNQSKDLLSFQMKAVIARDLYEINGYFYIINDRNESYKQALAIINNDKEYNRILQQ